MTSHHGDNYMPSEFENTPPDLLEEYTRTLPPGSVNYFSAFGVGDDTKFVYSPHPPTLPTPPSNPLALFALESPSPTTMPPGSPSEPPAVPVVAPAAITAGQTRTRTKFSVRELEELAIVVVDINPYGAKHGEKTKKWAEVAKKLKDQNLCVKSSVDTIKHKMNALLKYQDDPDSLQGSDVAQELMGLTKIKIAALLNRVSEMCHVASAQTETQKEQSQIKVKQDRIGGKMIQKTSMQVLGRRKRVSPAANTDSNHRDSDAENIDPNEPVVKKRCLARTHSDKSSNRQCWEADGDA